MGAVVLIELFLVFGGVLAFAVWELRSLRRARRARQRPPDDPGGPPVR